MITILDGVVEVFDWLRSKFTKKKSVVEKIQQTQTEKELATASGDPYISVVRVDIDPTTMGVGSFELDWNDIFVARLIRQGYAGKTDADIVDQWFTQVCQGVAMEIWEQSEAQESPARRVRTQNLGNGRSEVS